LPSRIGMMIVIQMYSYIIMNVPALNIHGDICTLGGIHDGSLFTQALVIDTPSDVTTKTNVTTAAAI